MDVGLSKVGSVYLSPNIHSLTRRDDDLSGTTLQKRTKILVAKISVVKVTAYFARSQTLLRHRKCWSLLIYRILLVSILASIHWSVCVPFLSSFAFVSPCLSHPNGLFGVVVVVVILVVVVGVTKLCLQCQKKNRKTKEKHRNSAGYKSRNGVVKETRLG